jgi:CDGSH-type Zn-finger protein
MSNTPSEPTALPACPQKAPIAAEVTAGKSFAWCTCGLSQKQPFCDGAHKGTGFKPLHHTPESSGTVWLCACKGTRNPPFCDGSHSRI